MTSPVLDLYGGQGEAFDCPGRELLMAAEPWSGSSYALRVMAVARAIENPRTQTVLACQDAERLRLDHYDGPGGLWQMLAPYVEAGGITYGTGGLLRFANGSTLRLTVWGAAARQYPDFVFLDDADDIEWPLFVELRERALAKGPAPVPRVTVVAKHAGAGWVQEHWGTIGREGRRVELRSADLPTPLRARRQAPAQASEAEKPRSLREHAMLANPALRWFMHVEVIAGAIERLFAGSLPPESRDRLFIAAPPQAGKSTITRLATSFWLRQNPHLWAGVGSYNQDYAWRNSRKVRDYYRLTGGQLRRDAWKVGSWELPEGGGMWAVGVGGGTGNPANLLVGDDLVKGAQQSTSRTIQNTAVEWYTSSWKARWNPYGGRLIELMIGTRWDLQDVQSQALEEGGWHCVILPGLMPDRVIEIPEGNTLEPDWRKPGEALCEELPKLNRKDLLEMRDGRGPQKRGAMKPRRFAALIQQQPKPAAGGGIFRDFWFGILPRDPALIPDPESGLAPGDKVYAAQARAWDLAATPGGGDSTTSTHMGRRIDNGRIVIRHAMAIHESAMGVKERIAAQMLRDGSLVTIGYPVDPGQAGKFQIAEMTTFLRAYAARHKMPAPPIRAMPTTGSKVARAKMYAEACEPTLENPPGVAEVPGNVDMVHGEWNADFREQHHDFDGEDGKADDYVDSAGDAYMIVSGAGTRVYLGWRRGGKGH